MIVLSNLIEVATPTRFELAISALTGPYVKPLHHGAVKKSLLRTGKDSNFEILDQSITKVRKNSSIPKLSGINL